MAGCIDPRLNILLVEIDEKDIKQLGVIGTVLDESRQRVLRLLSDGLFGERGELEQIRSERFV